MLENQDIFDWAISYQIEQRSLNAFWTFFRVHEPTLVAQLTDKYKGELTNISAHAEKISLVFAHWPSLEEPRIWVTIHSLAEKKYPKSVRSQGYRFMIGSYLVIFTPSGELEDEQPDMWGLLKPSES